MRILKYIFLLLLLSLVALSIFVATQKGDYVVERSKIINSSKSEVFNYVNDYRNWEDFGSWVTEDPNMKIIYSQKTVGAGASYSWEGKEGTGDMKTLFTKENDSISQKMNFNGTSSDVYWKFKDTIGGTKVSWKTKGKMSFIFKIYTAFNGGVDKVIGGMYEKSLTNLDKSLDYEINTFSVKVDGLVKKTASFYLKQTFTSKFSSILKNTRLLFPKIIDFCKKNNIVVKGKPFVIYETYDAINEIARISICVPIKEEIYISPGSDILSGKYETFEAVKTTLTGDYSHRIHALNKALEYIKINQLRIDPVMSHLEIYTTTKAEIKSPSKWVTEFYIPIVSKAVPVSTTTTYIQPNSTPVETTQEEPTVNNTAVPVKVIKPIVKPIIKKPEAKKIVAPKATEIDEYQ
ncbi:SRPBCC family protein [Flavobacterium sp. K5-23]|uniref:SRPBCC family protein n=1 Tax=Flavobacterium sp. K5-23 TaxID=2746225 RepID=UPI00200E1048|nr:SRPBCC family protein [Flavobacterium sp. K5-23]UQD56555.1 SRPBCC family protein [Flavobacterium sp. K5-23]